MTYITTREYRDNYLVIAEGHSGYGNRGSDIVCAGISTLVYALINTLLDEEASDRIKLVRKILRDGYAFIEIKRFDFSQERIAIFDRMCYDAYRNLSWEGFLWLLVSATRILSVS
jgi:uncharacterized protein YsxB (DUF464 family)